MCACVCVRVCMRVNKRDVENKTREIIVENKLWCMLCCCPSNYAGEERTTVLSFPKEESLRKISIKFVNRKDWEPTPSPFSCIKYFKEKHYRKGKMTSVIV